MELLLLPIITVFLMGSLLFIYGIQESVDDALLIGIFLRNK